MSDEAENLFRPLAKQWKRVLKKANDHKQQHFGKDAEECMNLYMGNMDFMWDSARTILKPGQLEGAASPAFRYVYCIAAELVQIFGPVMYFRNPHRKVNPRDPLKLTPELFIDPMMQMQAQQLQQQLQQAQPQGQPGQPPDPNQQQQLPPQMQMMLGMLQQNLQQIQSALQQQQQQFQILTLKEQAQGAQDAMRAQLLERYLNYTPNELDLKTHSRNPIDEALIKGAGICVTELYQPPGSQMVMSGSFYRSVNDLQLDPDASRYDEIMWGAIRCIEPKWQVKRDRPWLPKDALKGGYESANHEGLTYQDEFKGKWDRKKGFSNDLVRYWKIYSKMGMGDKLKTLQERETRGSADYEDYLDQTKKIYPQFGDFCYIEIADNTPYPLNFPPGSIDEDIEVLKARASWPIEFWRDDEWPWSILSFHSIPGQIWPMSHLRPAMGEIKFIQWAMSFLAQRVKNSCTDIIGCIKGAGEDIKIAIKKGSAEGFNFVELENALGKDIKSIISTFQFPQVNGDIWQMIAAVAQMLEKRLGLTELAYGMSARQFRSAEEASTKQQNYSVRPDDMKQRVEEWQTQLARKEALAISEHGDPDTDIEPILGATGAALWKRLIKDRSIDKIMRELDMRIEANSTAKPNQDRDAANIQQAMQYLLQFFETVYEKTGNAKPYNALTSRWCDAIDMKTDGMLLEDQPPPQDPNQQKMQMEMQQMQAQMQMEQQKTQTQLQALSQKMQLEVERHQTELQFDQQAHVMDLEQDAQTHALEMKTKIESSALDLLTQRKMAVEQVKAKRNMAMAARTPSNGAKK